MNKWIVIFIILQYRSRICEAQCGSTGCSVGQYCYQCVSPSFTQCYQCSPGTFKSCSGCSGSCTGGCCTLCTGCSPGKNQPSYGQSTCSDCVAGKFSGSNAASCVNCAAGKYSGTGASVCTDCASGYARPSSTSGPCSACSAGSDSCVRSPSNYDFISTCTGQSVCYDCATGYFSNSSASVCTKCVAGTFSNTTKSTTCRNCSTFGTYSMAGFSTCLSCAAGSFSNVSTASSCSLCEGGTYSSDIGASRCLDCVTGKYSFANATQCTDCLPGKFASNNRSLECMLCPPGKYQGTSGQSACFQCAGGTVSNTSGHTTCLVCKVGTYSNINHTSCISCPVGKSTPFLSPGASAAWQCAPVVNRQTLVSYPLSTFSSENLFCQGTFCQLQETKANMPYGNGEYIVYSYDVINLLNAFDKNATTEFKSFDNRFTNIGSTLQYSLYNGPPEYYVTDTEYLGPFISMKLPTFINFSHVTITKSNNILRTADNFPKNYKIYAYTKDQE